MGRFFNFEGPVFGFFDRASDIVILNIVFIICCLPVFTVGAAITALSSVTQKMARKEEGYIVRGFLKSFKQNFLQATAIWMILLLFGIAFLLDLRIMGQPEAGAIFRWLKYPVFILVPVYLFECLYVFPVLAKFENTLFNTMRNALLIAIKNLPWTVLLLLVAVIPFIALYYYTQVMVPVFVFAGFSLMSLLSSYIFKRLFDPLIDEEK